MRKGLVVLIAENDRDMRDYVRRCIEKHEIEIEEILEARDGQQALEIAHARRIDLLVTDGAMPRLDGFDLCVAFRASQPGSGSAVLVITGAYNLHDATRRAKVAGADGLLLKPFNAVTLCDKIDEVLRLRDPSGQAPEEQRRRVGEIEDDDEDDSGS